MNIKKYIAVIIASLITLSCFPVLAASDIVFINQTFEDFATGEGVSKSTITPDVNAPSPQIVVYGSPNAEVVEDRKNNKALLFHEIENTTDIIIPSTALKFCFAASDSLSHCSFGLM